MYGYKEDRKLGSGMSREKQNDQTINVQSRDQSWVEPLEYKRRDGRRDTVRVDFVKVGHRPLWDSEGVGCIPCP